MGAFMAAKDVLPGETPSADRADACGDIGVSFDMTREMVRTGVFFSTKLVSQCRFVTGETVASGKLMLRRVCRAIYERWGRGFLIDGG